MISISTLVGDIRLAGEAADLLIEEYGELDVQRHARYRLWMMRQGKVHLPPAWITASPKGDWSAPYRMPGDRLLSVLHFRVDETTFAEFTREAREQKKGT